MYVIALSRGGLPDFSINQPKDVMWDLTDYLGFAVLATIGFFKGVWTGLAQIPGYVRAEIRSARSRVDDIVKTRD